MDRLDGSLEHFGVVLVQARMEIGQLLRHFAELLSELRNQLQVVE